MVKAVLLDPRLTEEIMARRRAVGHDRWDEVWDGVWHVVASPNVEHQEVGKRLLRVLMEVVEDTGLGQVFYGLNVGDPEKGLRDFRIPDLLVILRNGAAQMRGSYIAGGPDFILEIHSPDDETEEKIPWYAAQGVRELLVLDRDTKALRLFRASGGQLREVTPPTGIVECETVPLRFERVEQGGVARVRVSQRARPGQVWHV